MAPFLPTFGGLWLIKVVSASFHTTSHLLRKYQVWTEIAVERGFTPEEVLKASKLGAYVCVDPDNEDLLLPLSPNEYKALKGQCVSNLKTLIVVLSPLDERKPSQELPPDQNSPSSSGESKPTSGSEGDSPTVHPRTRKVLGLLRKWYQGYWTRTLKIVDNRLAPGTDSGLLVTVLQSFLSRVALWSGVSNRRVLRRVLIPIITHLVSIFNANGVLGLSMYLKNSLFAVKSYLAGSPLRSTWQLGHGVRLQNGLPRFLPWEVRTRIRSGDPATIRWVNSLLFVYKGLTKTGPIEMRNLASIASPLPVIDRSGFWEFCKHFFVEHLVPLDEVPDSYTFRPSSFPLSAKAGPNGPVAAFAIAADAAAWVDRKTRTGKCELERWLEGIGYPGLWSLIEDLGKAYLNGEYNFVYKASLPSLKPALRAYFGKREWKGIQHKVVDFSPRRHDAGSGHPLMLGKLAFLREAAGKVRVVAIVDSFRQWLLEPVHLYLFKLLRSLPADATFDQQGKVQEFASRGYKDLFSYDLKSATDMIPRVLYLDALRPILGELTDLWYDLMVGIPFHYPKDRLDPRVHEGYAKIFYGRGQPMGALSSWASLAYLHHMLVLYAHHICVLDGLEPPIRGIFNDYLVLGDDIVIANRNVAEQYVKICAEFDIPIGMSKSLVSSKGAFEFASNFFVNGVNLSPVSFREDVSVRTYSQRIALGMRMYSRGWLDNCPSLASGLTRLLRSLVSPGLWKRYQDCLRNQTVVPAMSRLVQSAALSRITLAGSAVGALNLFGSFEPRNLVLLLVGRFQESTVCKKTACHTLAKCIGMEVERLKEVNRRSESSLKVLWPRLGFTSVTGYRLPMDLSLFYRNTISLPPLSRLITGPRPPLPRGEQQAPYLFIPLLMELIYELRRMEDTLNEALDSSVELEWQVLDDALQLLYRAMRTPDLPDLRLGDPELPFDHIMIEAVSLLKRDRRAWNAQGTIFSTGDDSWIRCCRLLHRVWKEQVPLESTTQALLHLTVEAGSSTQLEEEPLPMARATD